MARNYVTDDSYLFICKNIKVIFVVYESRTATNSLLVILLPDGVTLVELLFIG